ncbi:MAG TPA: haloacid dehalogenase [Anaerolineales bacterium]|nr:haloacid dehalogenase [Anaerolineales bacterium]
MDHLEEIAERIREEFDALNETRDHALIQARKLTRHCAHAIRAVHRREREQAAVELKEAGQLASDLTGDLRESYPSLYYAGYTQDALKEYAEAKIVFSLVDDEALPTPEELSLEPATYLKGLSEAVGELRRRILDILRGGYSPEAERLLQHMDEIYAVLVTMDYPDAVTFGLRRLTDICRGIIERTRGDLTISFRQGKLEQSLQAAEKNFLSANSDEAN